MELLLDAAGNVVVRNGKPVYKTKDGKEIEFDAVSTTDSIARLRTELGDEKKKVTDLTAATESFKGLDPAAARKALDTVKNLDDKKLVDAGEVEKVKDETKKALELQYKPMIEERDKLKADLFGEKVGGAFARSKFIAEKAAIPADFMQARFGSSFKVEGSKVVGYYPNGNPVFSQANPGDHAEFDEALEILVNTLPDKARILKGSGASGGGASGGTGGGGKGGVPTMARAEFNKLTPAEQGVKAREAAAGKLVLQD